jgi:hypothetical protein
MQDLMNMGNQLLGQQPYGLVQKQNKQSGFGGALGAAGGGALGFMAGGPTGALKAAQLGYGVGSAF